MGVTTVRPNDVQVAVLRPADRPAGRRTKMKVAIAGGDLVVIVAAMVIAASLQRTAPDSVFDDRRLLVGAVSLPLWLTAFVRFRLYRANMVVGRREEARRLCAAAAGGVAATALISSGLELPVSRGWLAATFAVVVPLLVAERELVRTGLTRMRRAGLLRRRVVVVGGNSDAVSLAHALATDPTSGYEVCGFVDDSVAAGTYLLEGCSVLGAVDDVERAVRQSGASGVMIVANAVNAATLNRLARKLLAAGIHVEVTSSLRDIRVDRLSLRPLAGYPVMHVDSVQREGWRGAAKRAFDIVVATAVFALAAPVLIVVAIAVKLDSPGPVLFRQKRVARHGVPFDIYKFRTMSLDAEERLKDLLARNEASGPLFKIRNDPRVTRVGRILRRWSLDELPQLLNVLRGEMSLVGPRPALPREVELWPPELHQRLRVKPGITGMWQVCGRRHEQLDEYTRLDLYYVDNWSFLADLAILARTIPAVLSRRGAW